MKYGDSFARDMFVRDLVLCNDEDEVQQDTHPQILFRSRMQSQPEAFHVGAKIGVKSNVNNINQRGHIRLHLNKGMENLMPSLFMTFESGEVQFYHQGDNVLKLSSNNTGIIDQLKLANDDNSVSIGLHASGHTSASQLSITSTNLNLANTEFKLTGTTPIFNGQSSLGALTIKNQIDNNACAKIELFGQSHASRAMDIEATCQHFSIQNTDSVPTQLFEVDSQDSTTRVHTQHLEVNPDMYFDRANTEANGMLYFGDDTQDGTIRIHVQDSGIRFERRVSGTWTAYHTFAVS
ncbi:MAG: hypothetical protein K0U52_00355 [Gammaproteobacteria bacterium]|nr:hypothetical protein [Gammaproteobacteria bacterium]